MKKVLSFLVITLLIVSTSIMLVGCKNNSGSQQQSFTVKFYHYDNALIKAQTVEQGQDATPPPNPSRQGYYFTGWSTSYTNIQSDKDIYAEYKSEIGNLDTDSPLIAKNLSDFTFNLSEARSLGIARYADIVSRDVSSSPVSYVMQTSNSQGKGNTCTNDNICNNGNNIGLNCDNCEAKWNKKKDQIVLVTVDDDENITEVDLDEESQNEGKLTADDFDLEIYRMQVFGEFTAVSYISTYWRETHPNDETWYYNNDATIFNRLKITVSDTDNYRNNEVISFTTVREKYIQPKKSQEIINRLT